MWVQSLSWEDPWRRARQPTPVFFPGESHGQRSLAGCSTWCRKESDTTEQLNTTQHMNSPHISLLLIGSLYYNEDVPMLRFSLYLAALPSQASLRWRFSFVWVSLCSYHVEVSSSFKVMFFLPEMANHHSYNMQGKSMLSSWVWIFFWRSYSVSWLRDILLLLIRFCSFFTKNITIAVFC